MSDPVLELLAAPPSPSLSVDEHAVYAGGRRRLRRRTLRRSAVGVVGIVGVAAITIGALGAGVDNDSLPAHPSPTASSSFPREMTTVVKDRYAVQIQHREKESFALLFGLTNGAPDELATLEVRTNRISLDVASAKDGLMIGVVPAEAKSALFTTSGEYGGHSTTMVPMPGTGYQAVVLDFEKPFAQPEMPRAIWVDEQGQVFDVDGSKAPSATVPGTKDHVFFTHLSRQIGVVEPGGNWYVKDFTSDWLPSIQTQFQQTGVWRTRAVVRVPMNSPQAVSMSWKGAESEWDGGVLPLGDSPWAMVVGTVDGKAKLTSVMYQDEAGEQHQSEVK